MKNKTALLGVVTMKSLCDWWIGKRDFPELTDEEEELYDTSHFYEEQFLHKVINGNMGYYAPLCSYMP